MSGASTVNGEVVVNRAMSLDGFIAGPDDSMDWGPRRPADSAPDAFAEIAAAPAPCSSAGGPWELGDRMEAEEPGNVDYPFSGSPRDAQAELP